MKRKGKKRARYAAALLFLLLLASGCGDKEAEKDLEQGKKILKELDKRDVQAIEEKITKKEKAEWMASDAYKNRTPDEKFTNAVILGDSITQGLEEYNVLSDAKVIATIGISIPSAGEDVDKAIALKPGYVFLAYGENDVENTNGDAELFCRQYGEMIDKIHKELPETEIFVNLILPVQQKVVDKTPVYAKLGEYNEALKRLCQEKNITAIDNSALLKEELYEPDGIHLGPEYYPAWVDHMAEVAGI